MDDKHSAMLWQMMQSLGSQTQDDNSAPAEPGYSDNFDTVPEEHQNHTNNPQIDMLLSLRSLMSPRQQKLIDLMIKMQEMKVLISELEL